MRSKSSFNGNAYNSSFTLTSPLHFETSGVYKFKFFTYINCPNVNCAAAGDFIKLNIKYDDDAKYTTVFQNGSEFGRFQDSKWNENIIDIHIQAPISIYVGVQTSKRTVLPVVGRKQSRF